jgi:hypothetical protein
MVPILKGIEYRLNLTPFTVKYKQLASISIVAIITAASPPKRRKARKIIESEKLNVSSEWGKVKLILGAIKIVNKNKIKKCQEKTFSFKFSRVKIKQKTPKIAIAILYKFEILFRFIGEKCESQEILKG